MSRRGVLAPPPPGAVEHLCSADSVLAGIIERTGPLELTLEPDLWWALVDAIASQQLSVKAAATIVGRIGRLGTGEQRPTPPELLALPDEALRGAGLSRAKVVYVKDLAAKWLDGTLEPARFDALDDEAIIAHLTQVKGVGRWTAEMVLIFTLARPDVLPVDDLGLKVAVQRAYSLEERPARDLLTRIAEPWRPFRSLATRYLWKSLNNTPPVAS